ncbi:MAG: CooT family nickel-binding protein [Desulfobacteraceae bacterium]|jgi:predicted RNA-binding protein
MCEANAYFIKDEKEQLILESVDVVQPGDDHTWRLVNIFGDQKEIRARIKKMRLVEHKILFEAIDD